MTRAGVTRAGVKQGPADGFVSKFVFAFTVFSLELALADGNCFCFRYQKGRRVRVLVTLRNHGSVDVCFDLSCEISRRSRTVLRSMPTFRDLPGVPRLPPARLTNQ